MTDAARGLELWPARGGVGFWIHVTPGSRRAQIGGTHGGALRVRVAAPPAEGRANAACRRLLADALGVPVGAVELDPGSRGRRKRVRVEGASRRAGGLEARLRELAGRDGEGARRKGSRKAS